MQNADMKVKIPRFNMKEEYSLKKVLSDMGMVDAFNCSYSNFTGGRLDLFPVLFLLVCMQF